MGENEAGREHTVDRTSSNTDAAELFKALGDETRLRIVNLLLQTDTSICVCEMVDALELPQYQISRHLALLRRVGIVTARKTGTWVYYGRNAGNAELAILVPGLRQILAGEPHATDAGRLERRLGMRRGGRCVIGFVEHPDTYNDLGLGSQRA